MDTSEIVLSNGDSASTTWLLALGCIVQLNVKLRNVRDLMSAWASPSNQFAVGYAILNSTTAACARPAIAFNVGPQPKVANMTMQGMTYGGKPPTLL